MSDDTQNSHNSGDSRRRRSRGGQNRNKNNNSDRRGSNGRQSGGGRRDGGKRQGGANRSSGSGKPQRRPMPKPIELTWWQKLLKSVGLYKEPVRPPRPERRPDAADSKKTREPRRSKTRDVRSGDSEESSTDEPRRNKRPDRSNRDKNRPRGGDPSTVENQRVYVGNLSYETSESDLEELFKGVGAVRRVEIVYNRKTHRSKGYGFIEMIDVDEAKRTVEVLHDQFFMGRQLTVSGAKSKDHEEAEKEEPINDAQNSTIPPLAPINPNKEETLDLIDETPKQSSAEETTAEISAEETHAEIPTEEFSPETDAQEEVKNQA